MEVDDILKIASELGMLIRDNAVVVEYNRLQEQLDNDRKAQELLTTLIQMGAELSEKGSRGEEVKMEESAEYRLLEEEMENNTLVKNYIVAQKNYFNFLKEIQDAIRSQL